MKRTEILMGMPITVEVNDAAATESTLDDIHAYFKYVDDTYSTYKADSEISRINYGLPETEWSDEMRTVLELCEQTKQETDGYFDIVRDGMCDPSGLVKGWAIQNAAKLLRSAGLNNFYVEAGGDIQVQGVNTQGDRWKVGIRNPFDRSEVVKVVGVTDEGVATSGTYIRGQHIYNPHASNQMIEDVASLTVIGPNIYDADRFATAAFAMGKPGIEFVEKLPGFEGYMIDADRIATMTSGFERYVITS